MRKVLQLHISNWQVALVLLASALGMICLGLPMMLYSDAQQMIEHEHRLFDDKFLVLNKKVGMLHTLGLSQTGFTEEEMDNLKTVKGIERVGSFENNAFELWAEADFGGGQVVRTEMFLEGVEDEFIDDPPAGWFWNEGQTEVPIMVPTDYLALYNFGFAPGQNLPGISKDLAKQSRFTLYVSGHGKQMNFEGRIAGFSDRIETILAPKSFLSWANHYFAPEAKFKPKRVIVKASESVALQQKMAEQGYETNKERLQSVRFQQLVKQILGAATGIGVALILLALGSFILFSTLLITRSQERLHSLFLLGFSRKQLAILMGRKLLVFPVIAFLIALPAAIAIRWAIVSVLGVFMGQASMVPDLFSIAGMVLILLIYLALAMVDMWRQITVIERATD
jgi:hypothetical protein